MRKNILSLVCAAILLTGCFTQSQGVITENLKDLHQQNGDLLDRHKQYEDQLAGKINELTVQKNTILYNEGAKNIKERLDNGEDTAVLLGDTTKNVQNFWLGNTQAAMSWAGLLNFNSMLRQEGGIYQQEALDIAAFNDTVAQARVNTAKKAAAAGLSIVTPLISGAAKTSTPSVPTDGTSPVPVTE